MIALDDVVADPEGGGTLRRATDTERARIAAAIEAGAVQVVEGAPPEDVRGAYVGEDGRTVYVDDPRGFPSLLVERRLVLDEAL